jgi:spoIIIJ-associated protein
MVEQKEYYGDTVAELIAKACRELGISQEHLEIEVLETGSAGIFGLCRKKARIRVTVKAPQEPKPEVIVQEAAAGKSQARKKAIRKPKAAPLPPPQEDVISHPMSAEEAAEPPSQEVLATLEQDITQLLTLMGFPSTVEISTDKSNVLCHISDTHQAALVGQDGKTLDSLQYLLRKMTARLLPARTKFSLEVGDYRERRLEALKQQVLELAAKVRENGITQAIPALNPSERRLVHMVLQEDKELRSRSVGEGLFKKVLIYKPGRKKNTRKGKKEQHDDEPSEN